MLSSTRQTLQDIREGLQVHDTNQQSTRKLENWLPVHISHSTHAVTRNAHIIIIVHVWLYAFYMALECDMAQAVGGLCWLLLGDG